MPNASEKDPTPPLVESPGLDAVQSQIRNPKPKIRLHLSTCLILLLTAATLLGANMYPQPQLDFFQAQEVTAFGWPFVCHLKIYLAWDNRLLSEWHYDNLFFDLLAAAAILTTVAWLCELRIRRWEKQRGQAKIR